MRTLLVLLVVSLLAAPAFAGPPATGNWSAIDGRFSESWVGGQEGQIGNTLHAQSWDNTTLGTEWKLHCAAAFTSPFVLYDTRVNGTGDVVYQTKYQGGTFWLSKNGPWGDGTEDYDGILGITTVVATHSFVQGQRTGVRSNVTVQGEFNNYDGCFVYTISNATIEGFPPMPFPADYPELVLSTCLPGGVGAWGTATQVSLTVYDEDDPQCEVPVRNATWGHIKSLYGD